jgi:hypothetical protein
MHYRVLSLLGQAKPHLLLKHLTKSSLFRLCTMQRLATSPGWWKWLRRRARTSTPGISAGRPPSTSPSTKVTVRGAFFTWTQVTKPCQRVRVPCAFKVLDVLLRAEGFCSLDVLCEGLVISKLQFCKRKKVFQFYIFFHFLVIKTLFKILIRIGLQPKMLNADPKRW